MPGPRRALKAAEREPQLPGSYRARVTKPPAASGDPLEVQLVYAPDALSDVVTLWTRATLPAAGDECLVSYDDRHEPWIVAWKE